MRKWTLPDRESVRYEKMVMIEGSGLMFDYDDVNHDEAWAEAELAAAAPELLDALDHLLAYRQDGVPLEGVQKAKALIAKLKK